METNAKLAAIVAHLIENMKPVTTSELTKELDEITTNIDCFSVMHELVSTGHVTQETHEKYGKTVLVWALANGQASAFELWRVYLCER